MAVTLLGTVIADGSAFGQSIHLYERTSDPTSTSVGDWWYRSDTDEFKAVTNTSGTVTIPAIDPANAGSSVSDYLRATTSNGERAVPLADTADATYPMFQVVTPDGTSLGVHDAATVTVDLPSSWTKSSSNPVLSPSSSGWDSDDILGSGLYNDGGTFRALYSGGDGDPGTLQIGTATSSNLETWTKDANNPTIPTGSAGAWDETWTVDPSEPYYDGSVWHVYYAGKDSSNNWGLGHATNSNADMSGAWTKDAANPVLTTADLGSWGSSEVFDPAVDFDGTTIYIYFTGGDGSQKAIGYATADTSDWTSLTIAGSNPIVTASDIGYAADSGNGVTAPTVWTDADGYHHMWCDADPGNSEQEIVHLSTTDRDNFINDSNNNPVLTKGSSGAFDDTDAVDPTVVKDGQALRMLYVGYDGSTHRNGYAYIDKAAPAQLDPPSFSEVFSDSFESGISGYSNDTGAFTTTTLRAFDGSDSLTKNDGGGNHKLIYQTGTVPFTPSNPKRASVRYYIDDSSDHAGGVCLIDSATGDGYLAYVNTGGDKLQIYEITAGDLDPALTNPGSITIPTGEWLEIELEHDGGDGLTATMYDASGSTVETTSTTDATTDPDTLGVEMFPEGVEADLLVGEEKS